VSAEPPLLTGADHERSTLLSSIPAARFVGAPGTLAGVIELLVPDDVLVPTAFVAVTVKVYVTPLVSPVIVADVELLVVACPPVLAVTV
jgi:hypothetical protein